MQCGKRRVVVTGLGAVSGFGVGVDTLWSKLMLGNTRFSKIPDHWKSLTSFTSHVYAPFTLPDYSNLGLSTLDNVCYDTVTLNAIIATLEALDHAKINTTQTDRSNLNYQLDHINERKTGVFIGTGIGGISSFCANYTNHITRPLHQISKNAVIDDYLQSINSKLRFDRFIVPKQMVNAPANAMGIILGVKGPVYNYSVACASSAVSIGNAFRNILNGTIDVAICGGTEYCTDYNGAIFKAFDSTKTLCTAKQPEDIVGPFDRDRSGFIFSEGGAGILVLESHDHATKRNANILAEVLGYEESFDAHHIMTPSPEGEEISYLIHSLIDNCGVQKNDIDYINTHGTGTVVNDKIETNLINKIFKHEDLVANSTKSILGHTLGASASLEAITCVQSLTQRCTHKTANTQNPISKPIITEPIFNRDFLYALNLSYAFGGQNAAMLFKKWNNE